MPIRLQKFLTLFAGPLLFLGLILWHPFTALSSSGTAVLGLTLWMALWWILEPVPLAATSLLPVVVFPLLGVMPMQQAAFEYSNEIIFLFMGSFFMGMAIEKWELHKRFALAMLGLTGMKPRLLLFVFMSSTAFISMWISNTATAAMMLPIGLAFAAQFNENGDRKTGKALLLGIAYAAGIGGMATPVGTPTNAIFMSTMEKTFQQKVLFEEWTVRALPLAILLLIASWAWLTFVGMRPVTDSVVKDKKLIRHEHKAMGKMGKPQYTVLAVFILVALVWITGQYWLYKWFPALTDSSVAIAGAILLFILPAVHKHGKNTPLLDWESARNIPWEILLLFGGGLSLALGFKVSGLAAWLGSLMHGLSSMHLFLVIMGIVTFVVLLSEVASNVATAAMLMPVLATLSETLHTAPFGLLMIATLAASCGVALPVATPPNAIVFGSGKLKTGEMIKNGIAVDAICILILGIYGYFFLL